MLLVDLANVATSEPSGTNTDWAVLPVGASIIPKIANYSIPASVMAAGNATLTNIGATIDIQFQLPARGGDYRVEFVVAAAHYIKIIPPSGERLYFYNSQQTAVNGYIRSNVPGESFKIIGTPTLGYTVYNIQHDVKVDE